MILPVPTAGIIAAIALIFMTAGFPPKAARTRSLGRPKSPLRILCVPASSEFNAETRVAFPQPKFNSTEDPYEEETTLTRILHCVQARCRENSHLARCQRLTD
jgi:hypothetical protein